MITRDQARANLAAALKAATTALKAVRYDSARYANAIDDAARAFWKEGSPWAFNSRMSNVIRFGLRDAFLLGAEDIGISEEDLIEPDWRDLEAIIQEELSHIAGLSEFIQGLMNDKNATFSDVLPRLQMWELTFDDVRSQAKVILGKDEKLEWVYGDTEHCSSCERLNGIVKRSSFWNSHGVTPRNPPNGHLECGGWKCRCELRVTDKPVTRGKLPKLP